jgi:hypothetical protein
MQNSKYALKSQILPEVYLSTWEFSRYYLSNYDSGSVLTWASAQVLPEYTCAQLWYFVI